MADLTAVATRPASGNGQKQKQNGTVRKKRRRIRFHYEEDRILEATIVAVQREEGQFTFYTLEGPPIICLSGKVRVVLGVYQSHQHGQQELYLHPYGSPVQIAAPDVRVRGRLEFVA